MAHTNPRRLAGGDFLSTFVMIGQNRHAAFQQAKADHDFEAQELELKTNTFAAKSMHSPKNCTGG